MKDKVKFFTGIMLAGGIFGFGRLFGKRKNNRT